MQCVTFDTITTYIAPWLWTRMWSIKSFWDHHRGRDEGYRMHQAGCLSLRNIAADPKGQAAVGPKGFKAITDEMEEYRAMREVVEGSMGVLCNLCALPGNG
eukprot:1003590_1